MGLELVTLTKSVTLRVFFNPETPLTRAAGHNLRTSPSPVSWTGSTGSDPASSCENVDAFAETGQIELGIEVQ